MKRSRGATLAERLARPINPASQIFFAIYTIIWGGFVLSPLWDVFSQAPIYRQMSNIAPEAFWGSVALICGSMMLWGVLKNSIKSLTVGAFIGFTHWLVISMAFVYSDWQNPGWLGSSMVCLLCGYIYLNMRLNKNKFAL